MQIVTINDEMWCGSLTNSNCVMFLLVESIFAQTQVSSLARLLLLGPVRRRKLVVQLYLPCQTEDRTCPNRRRCPTSQARDESKKEQDTMWRGAFQECAAGRAGAPCPSACVWGGSATFRADRTGRWNSPSEVSESGGCSPSLRRHNMTDKDVEGPSAFVFFCFLCTVSSS